MASLFDSPHRLVMASKSDLHQYLRAVMEITPSSDPVNLKEVRNFVSSPRLFDVYIKGPATEHMVPVGDTFLDMHTMLADKPQKTYAISLRAWEHNQDKFRVVEYYAPSDQSIIQLQIWPFEPNALDHFQMSTAVAMAYTRGELDAESRISSALDELLSPYNFYTDEF